MPISSLLPPAFGAILLAVVLLVPMAVRRRLNATGREVHRRGTVVIDSRARHRLSVRRTLKMHDGYVSLGGIRLTPVEECKHFKLIGTTGTGKSTAIRELLIGALRRGDRAIISDPDGGYLAQLYRRYRGDVVLNPFERESMRWDPFAEISNAYDIEQLASALIPFSDDPGTREWRGYARTFFTAVFKRCGRRRNCSLNELWRLLAIASNDELRPLLGDTPAQPFLEPDNARMFGSIRSVLSSAIAPLEYIRAQRAAPFSVRAWVRGGRGVLFIPYRAGQIAALRSIIAAWMRLAIVEAMSQQEERDQRLWFIVDELDALGAIDGLKDALARLRKFGGRCVLGFQSLAQVSGTYGSDAQTIVENCGNTLILRCSGSEHGGTSNFASRLIGEREVRRRQITHGRDRDGGMGLKGTRRSTQSSYHYATEVALMPSQLEQLADLTGYLKLASRASWQRVQIRR
jgi:type IV secretory pathway TraG/TraD family ATPase VirD4